MARDAVAADAFDDLTVGSRTGDLPRLTDLVVGEDWQLAAHDLVGPPAEEPLGGPVPVGHPALRVDGVHREGAGPEDRLERLPGTPALLLALAPDRSPR